MRILITRTLLAAIAFILLVTTISFTQNRGPQRSDAEERERRNQIEAELQSLAVVQRKVMVPMRDGLKMQADIYVPKGAAGDKFPVIFSRTPYNFNWWDVKL